ncbi:MAG: hypothetical protein Hals2KO_13350 [Halioglobus sp.]
MNNKVCSHRLLANGIIRAINQRATTMFNAIASVVIVCSALLLGACGQMGPLYMPVEETPGGPAAESGKAPDPAPAVAE